MNRNELAPILRAEFKKDLQCGVEKIKQPGLENIWFVVPPPPPEKIPPRLSVEAVSKANRLIEQLPRSEAANDLDRMVSYLFVRREAVQSSRIEGTWSTIDHILTPAEIYDQNEGRSERASVLGYANALESEFNYCNKKGTSIFSIELVCRLHKKIMSKDPHFQKQSGQIRAPHKPGAIVFIGGLRRKEESVYNPTPPRHVLRCLNQVMAWLGNDELIELGNAGMGMSLPVRMAIGHAHFEAVHPFPDGNGRVGRMLLTLQMACHGLLPLYLSGFIETEKQSYIQALQQAQKKLQYDAIVEFMCNAIIASYHEAEQTKASIKNLPLLWKSRGAFRESSAAQLALQFLITNPIFSVKQLQKALSVTAPAAHRATSQLVEKKIIRERTGFVRNRLFAAEEVIALLSRGFNDNPSTALTHAQRLIGG